MPKKVLVALSGGVDSAVAAHMLVAQGYAVEGAYMKYASEATRGHVDPDACTWRDDLDSVVAVGKHLGIRTRVLNVEQEYRNSVIAEFLSESQKGRTPNPDVRCNQHVKFGSFFRYARAKGYDMIATGHYARIGRHAGRMQLRAGKDREKDQSYFLYAVEQSVLPYVRFPIGHLTKREVRSYARMHALPNAERPDSQGLCFVGPLNVRDFVYGALGKDPGNIVAEDGTVLGRHEGLSYYTIGQRHGFGIGGGVPYYVAQKRLATKTLVVARGAHNPLLANRALIASNCRWYVDTPTDAPFRCLARIRYRQPLAAATVRVFDNAMHVEFDEPQRAITPGQSVVLYENDTVLGGGTIDDVPNHLTVVT